MGLGQMHGALIGYGTIGSGHLIAYQEIKEMSIDAIVDPVEKRRELATAQFPSIRAYANIDELLNCEVIDFIDICTPPNTHCEYIIKGLSNKWHVLCEKPLILSMQDYGIILPLIKMSNCVLYPGHNYKFAPILQLIKNTVQSNNFGQIIGGHFRTFRNGHALGIPEWNPHWRRFPAISGGGILRDHGTHSIYMSCHLSQKQPISVSCLAGNLRNDDFMNTEDTALMTLHFEGDKRFVIDLSWAAKFRNSYYAVSGTQESMIIENDTYIHKTATGALIRGSLRSEFDDPSHIAWFVQMFADFRDVIINPERQLSLLQEAQTTTLVIDQAYESAKQGGIIVQVPRPSIEL